jgi:glycosyltransferase involved in cell wall biosynthesis
MIFSIEKGGAETYLYNLVDNLKDNVNFFIVCDHKGTNHEKIEKKCKNVEIIKMNNVFDIKAARKIATYCKKNNIHIIQTHFLRENYIGILSKLFNPNIKVIWTAHLIAENKGIIRFFNKIFSKFVDKIICVSEAVKTSLVKEGIPLNKAQVVYNGVDTNYFRPMDDNTIRKELSIEDDTLVLTTISRFNKEKGYDFLMEGLKELKIHIPYFKMLLVGEGEEKDFIKEKVKEYDLQEQVVFLGYREDIPQILAATDIYISPSRNEAISFSIIEALSCSKPVVATEVGGVPEIFHKGNCGILIPFGDTKVFVESIMELYDNKNYELVKSNCREIVKNNFSQNKMLEGTYKLYSKLAEN